MLKPQGLSKEKSQQRKSIPFWKGQIYPRLSKKIFSYECSISPLQKPERLVFNVGLTIGLCIRGDSFLYGNLPIEAENLGIALPSVGILLSANRLVRLISNTWASAIFEKLGPRQLFIFAAVLSLLTTALYGIGWGFSVFLLARMGWGIAWSALRQRGYQAVWTGGEYPKGKLMGLLWGPIRLGSAFSVLFGGYLQDLWGYRAGVYKYYPQVAELILFSFSP